MKRKTIGIDEVGRGALAGPLAVAALSIIDSSALAALPILDSKQLTKHRRKDIYDLVHSEAKAGRVVYAISYKDPKLIDKNGIAHELRAAVADALVKIGAKASDSILLDGSLYAPRQYINAQTHVKGDERFLEIALASIVAKVDRDRKMENLAQKMPEYCFETNAGYGTKAHREALLRLGLSEHHRATFCRFLLRTPENT